MSDVLDQATLRPYGLWLLCSPKQCLCNDEIEDIESDCVDKRSGVGAGQII
jgi:hypothetical protein